MLSKHVFATASPLLNLRISTRCLLTVVTLAAVFLASCLCSSMVFAQTASSTPSPTASSAAAAGSAIKSNVPTQVPGGFRLKDESASVPVSPTRSFSLQTCFDKANDNNKEVIAAEYNIPFDQAAIKIAGAIPNPRFSLLYGFGPAFTIIIAGNPQQFGMMQQFQTNGKRRKAISVARANLNVSELQAAATLFDVHDRVRRAYAEQAAAEALLRN